MAVTGGLNLHDYFLQQRVVDGLGQLVAIRFEDKLVTYQEVLEHTESYAVALLAAGVRPRDRVLMALADSPDYVASLFAILKIGAVAVMLNPDLRPDQLAAIIESSEAQVAVVDEAGGTVITRAPTDRKPTLVGAVPATAVVSPIPTFATRSDDPAIWLFSGGTTGLPKIVVQSHGSFANTTELYGKRAMAYRADDITVSVPKLYFGYATGSNLFFPFSVGASTVLFSEKPNPQLLFDLIAQHHPTILVNVPSMVNLMVAHPRPGNLECLRFATTAGEALPVTLYYRWVDTFGVELLDGLGTAEMWHIFISNRLQSVRPGTVGTVVEGFEVKICDEEGRPLPVGEVGRLWVKGDSLALEYWRDPGQTEDCFRDGWFVGSDLISRDSDGFITHHGRSDDALKVKGKWLSPQEVESCLLDHPAVIECAVVGIPDDDGLLKPVAFVVPRSNNDPNLEDDLKNHVLARLEPYKHPRRVVFLDALPTTHLGKVDRGKLKAMAP